MGIAVVRMRGDVGNAPCGVPEGDKTPVPLSL